MHDPARPASSLAFLTDESGATAIEYGLIASLIALTIVGALTAFSGATIAMYNSIETAVSTASPGGP